jgi:predicted HicB family RNase H-like nuclease
MHSLALRAREDSAVLFGHVIGLRDVITFQGESVAEVTQAFHDSVDYYLDFCARRGESPEKPYSGQFVLRLSPELHRELAHTAEARSLSLNALIESALENEFLIGPEDHPGCGGRGVSSASKANQRLANKGKAAAKKSTSSLK